MQFLSIGVNECADDIIQHITNEIQQLRDEKISYSINEKRSCGSASIICSINEEKDGMKINVHPYDVLKGRISNILADYIIRQYEKKLIMRIINSNYCYFSTIERKEILNKTSNIIRNDEKNFFGSFFQTRRRNVIVRKLLDYFEGSNNLILDGFVNFRLKDYIRDLEEIVNKAVDDFLMEREYREFIKLLRYFVDIQEPKLGVIHVVAGYENKYLLLNDDKKEITDECIREFTNDATEGEINYDDLLVSSLITHAPDKILIHCMSQFRNKELLETIKNVFTGKVIFCTGCEICMPSIKIDENKEKTDEL